MLRNNGKIELLAPAGDLEKLKIAIDYGADAVYFGGELFSLRAAAGNFTREEILEGIKYVHDRGKRCYLTINIFPHNEDIIPMKEYIKEIKDFQIDGFIVSDPGTINVIREYIPDAEIHLSTQANTTNYESAKFWYNFGVKRIVLAREMTMEEIIQIGANTPEGLEVEAFVQGAMCISYSGRCLLSNFMVERDANKGACAHPCRWKYALVEEQREGVYYPIEEDDRGTYIMNSRDLCMLEHMPQLIEAGVASAKIEGRMKSVFYVATIVAAYRKVIDEYYKDKENYKFDESLIEEIKKVSHREFTTGFYFNKPTNEDQNYLTSAYTRGFSFVGIVRDYDENTGMAIVEQRNKMVLGEELEVFGPYENYFTQKLAVLLDEEGNPLESAPHPQQILQIKMDKPVKKNFILRKRKV